MMGERYDILSQLPIEIAQNILMRIPPEALCNVSKCCKRWKDITRGSYFWKTKSKQNYSFAGSEYVKSECYRKYVQNFSNHWQGHYMYNYELEYNWKNGLCKKISVDSILDIQSFVYMDDDMLIVAKANEICIINNSNGLIEKTFQAEHLYRAEVEKSEGLLIALCRIPIEESVIIKVWDLKTKETTVKEHKLPFYIQQFWIYKHLIGIIIPRDNELCVFNIKQGSIDYLRTQVRLMCFGNDTIAIATITNLIEIRDMNFKILMEFTCCPNSFIKTLEMKNNYLFVECLQAEVLYGIVPFETSICVWDFTTKTKLCTIENGQLVDLTFMNESKIICLKLSMGKNWFESLSLPHFITQEIGQKTVSCSIYASNKRFLFTLTKEQPKSLKMWCARTLKLIRSFDLKTFSSRRYVNRRYGHMGYVMISEKNVAYTENDYGNYIVHIMDFGSDIKNKITSF